MPQRIRLAAIAVCALASIIDPAFADRVTVTAPGLRKKPQWIPFAVLLLADKQLNLTFPLDGSTSSADLRFVVFGNIRADLSAEPSAFVEIGSQKLGKATIGSSVVGYDVAVQFSKENTARHRNLQALADLSLVAGEMPSLAADEIEGILRDGVIRVTTNRTWTVDGGLPLPGNHVGQIVLTLTPDF